MLASVLAGSPSRAIGKCRTRTPARRASVYQGTFIAGCSWSEISTSSSGCQARPKATILTPSVAFPLSATSSGWQLSSAAARVRACSCQATA